MFWANDEIDGRINCANGKERQRVGKENANQSEPSLGIWRKTNKRKWKAIDPSFSAWFELIEGWDSLISSVNTKSNERVQTSVQIVCGFKRTRMIDWQNVTNESLLVSSALWEAGRLDLRPIAASERVGEGLAFEGRAVIRCGGGGKCLVEQGFARKEDTSSRSSVSTLMFSRSTDRSNYD